MKTIRTAILDELYEHIAHVLESTEDMGIDVETGILMKMEWVSVKRDEGRLIVKVRVPCTFSGHAADAVQTRELVITVEKS